MHRLESAIHNLHEEFTRSVQKHGDWEGYSVEDIMKAVFGELKEVRQAKNNKDIHGPHGLRTELLHLANVCLKGHIILGKERESETWPAGAANTAEQ